MMEVVLPQSYETGKMRETLKLKVGAHQWKVMCYCTSQAVSAAAGARCQCMRVILMLLPVLAALHMHCATTRVLRGRCAVVG